MDEVEVADLSSSSLFSSSFGGQAAVEVRWPVLASFLPPLSLLSMEDDEECSGEQKWVEDEEKFQDICQKLSS